MCFSFVFAEEEAAEVKKSKLYRPATKFVPVSPNISPILTAENKKAVSLFSDFSVMVLLNFHCKIKNTCLSFYPL